MAISPSRDTLHCNATPAGLFRPAGSVREVLVPSTRFLQLLATMIFGTFAPAAGLSAVRAHSCPAAIAASIAWRNASSALTASERACTAAMAAWSFASSSRGRKSRYPAVIVTPWHRPFASATPSQLRATTPPASLRSPRWPRIVGPVCIGPIDPAPNPKLVEEGRPNTTFASATSDAFFERPENRVRAQGSQRTLIDGDHSLAKALR